MSVLRALRKLVLGETWLLPLGILLAVAACFVLRDALDAVWRDIGGFVLLLGVALALLGSVATSARRR
jgi:hypothetical protein